MENVIEEYCENELILFGELTGKGLSEYYDAMCIQDQYGEYVDLKPKEQTK